jgi:hypothetical protein
MIGAAAAARLRAEMSGDVLVHCGLPLDHPRVSARSAS